MADFLFGAGTSAHQVEGYNKHSDWWEFEQNVLANKGVTSGKAANHFELYEHDFELASQLGHNAHRFSIEWAKIEPERGKINFNMIDHYKKVFHSLKQKNITPIVTLFHFTLPSWFAKKGGFLNKKNGQIFYDYCKFIATEFKEDLSYIITINEPLVYAYQSYLIGQWPPQKKKYRTFTKVLKNLADVHNRVYDELKFINPDFKIAIAKNNQIFEPARRQHFMDRLLVKYFIHRWNHKFLDRIRNHMDFVGLNYYFYRLVKFSKVLQKNFFQAPYPTCRKTDMSWEVYPKGIYILMRDLCRRYKLPVLVTENGVADERDQLRESILKETLGWVFKAKEDGIDVFGYLHWALIDNFEWDSGFEPRFGLIKVDYNNYTRTIRPSALAYKKLIKEYQHKHGSEKPKKVANKA